MKKKSNIFWGLLLIGVAIFLIFNQIGYITADIGVFHVILGLIFFAALISGIANRSFPGIFFPLGFLWIIFDEFIGFPFVSAWMVLLIALLLSAGFSALFPNFRKKKGIAAYVDVDVEGKHQKIVDECSNGNIFYTNRFGASAKYITSSDFRGGELQNDFGELKIYFDNTVLPVTSIDLYVSNNFGSLQLYVPKEWTVKQNVNAFAATVTEKNRNNSSGSPEIRLNGNTNFGEISITYV